MKKILTIIISLIIVGGVAWYLYALSQAGTPAPAAPTAPSLTLAQVETATNNSISKDANAAPLAAFGAINNDGVGDAAVIVPDVAIGSGHLLEIFLLGTSTSLTESGQPLLIATTSDLRVPATFNEFGIGAELNPITSIGIHNGIVAVSGQAATTSSTQIALAPVTIQYKLVSGVLVKIGQPFSIPTLPAGQNAIGTGESWGTYTDSADSISFDYPSGVVNLSTKPSDISQIHSYIPISSTAKAVLTLPPSQYAASTTVRDVAVVLNAAAVSDFSTCINSAESDYVAAPVETLITPPVAGVATPNSFYQLPGVTAGGCWAGGCAFGTLFVTYQNGTCYQFGLQAAVADPGAIVTSQSQFQQMDHNNTIFENRIAALYYQILSTIQFQ